MKTKLILCLAFIQNLCIAIAAVGQELPFDLRHGSSDESVFHMVDRQIGWARGTNGILRTRNGGQSWQTVLPTRPREPIGCFFYDANTAWIAVGVIDGATNATIFRTADAGKTWQSTEVREYIPIVECLFSFPSKKNGWLMVIPEHGMNSEPGTLYRSGDAGKTWQQVSSGQWFDEAASLKIKTNSAEPGLPFAGEVLFQNDSSGWLVGSFASTTPAYLFATGDGGLHWREQTLPCPVSHGPGRMEPMGSPRFFPRGGKTGVLEGNFVPDNPQSTDRYRWTVVYRTRDGGQTWQPGLEISANYSRCSFYSALNGYLWKDELLWVSKPANGTLVRTRDSGVSWAEVKPQKSLPDVLRSDFRVVQLEFVDDKYGWAVALGNTLQAQLFQTTDGGKNWIELLAK